jgi:hypothetical protein
VQEDHCQETPGSDQEWPTSWLKAKYSSPRTNNRQDQTRGHDDPINQDSLEYVGSLQQENMSTCEKSGAMCENLHWD